MEILFISHKYPPTIGGMEKQSFELIAYARKKHKVHQLVHIEQEESKFSFFLKLRSRVKKILKKHPNIDIIHLNDGLMGLLSTWLKSYTDIPVVLTFHGLDLVFPNPLYQKRIKQKFVNYDGLICVSTATADECLKRGFAREKVFVVPNGVDHDLVNFDYNRQAVLNRFQKEFGIDLSQKKIISTLGRPVMRKGFSWFLQHVVPDLADDVMVVMIGPLSPPKKESLLGKLVPKSIKDQITLMKGGLNDEAAIRELLKDDKYKNKVIQTGKLPFDFLLGMLYLSDLFAMPNIKMAGDAEGFGLVALEASLCQTVVLASRLEGITEAIQDQKNGYLLPSADAAIWIKTINDILKNPTLLKTKGQEFQQFTLENYGWKKMAAGYVDVFEQVIQKHITS